MNYFITWTLNWLYLAFMLILQLNIGIIIVLIKCILAFVQQSEHIKIHLYKPATYVWSPFIEVHTIRFYNVIFAYFLSNIMWTVWCMHVIVFSSPCNGVNLFQAEPFVECGQIIWSTVLLKIQQILSNLLCIR